jgi:hypothetical protein
MNSTTHKTHLPFWLPLIVLLHAAAPIAQHGWIAHAPPEGTVATGLHIADDALFLEAMGMFDGGFHSPYATCRSVVGSANPTLYAVPHLWLYGALGWAGARLGMTDHFMLLGIANGFGIALYLLAVYAFLRVLVPRLANLAWLFFAFSGGLGGVAYLVALLAGRTEAAGFDTYFFRFAVYDLMEGPHLRPDLYTPRLYYTFTLAMLFAVLAASMHDVQKGRPWPRAWVFPLVALACFINARFGVFAGGILGLFLLTTPSGSTAMRLLHFTGYVAPAAFGLTCSGIVLGTNPAVYENHVQVANMAMWISPFIAAALPQLFLAFAPTLRAMDGLSPGWRALAWALAGYLAAYCALYAGFQQYMGNLATGRDGAIAAQLSDYAISGAMAGLAYAWWTRRHAHERAPGGGIALWFLLFLALSISGFGQGWFLRFGPQRLQVLLWLPLCMLAAAGALRLGSPLRQAAIAGMVILGAASFAVASLFFQGPLLRAHAEGPFAPYHFAIMKAEDGRLMGALGEGTVLAPKPASDVIVRHTGQPVVFGIGSFNLTTVPFTALSGIAAEFFGEGTPEHRRMQIVRDWCADWVFCPATWPVPASVLADLRSYPWLVEVASGREAGGAVFAVRLHLQDSVEMASAATGRDRSG